MNQEELRLQYWTGEHTVASQLNGKVLRIVADQPQNIWFPHVTTQSLGDKDVYFWGFEGSCSTQHLQMSAGTPTLGGLGERC